MGVFSTVTGRVAVVYNYCVFSWDMLVNLRNNAPAMHNLGLFSEHFRGFNKPNNVGTKM